jgi:hypothetical protein
MGGTGLSAAAGFLSGAGGIGGRTVARFGMSPKVRLPSKKLKRAKSAEGVAE